MQAASFVTPSYALKKLCGAWNLEGSSIEQTIAVASAAVRSVIASSRDGVPTVALKSTLGDRIAGLFDQEHLNNDVSRALGVGTGQWIDAVLTRLVHLGEASRTESKRWQATASRLVRPGKDSQYAIVLGCQSTNTLQELLGVEVRQCGILRYCRYDSLSKSLRDNSRLWQRADSWLKLDPQPLRKWTAATMAAEIANASVGPQLISEFDVLVRSRQGYRWKNADAIRALPAQIYLCRSLQPGSSRMKEYWLATFIERENRISIQQRAPLRRDDGVRMLFGIQAASGQQRQVSVELEHGMVLVRFKGRFPMPEGRIFSTATVTSVGFRVPKPLFDVTAAIMESLGLSITDAARKDIERG